MLPGHGYIEMDIGLFISCCAAAGVNLYYLGEKYQRSGRVFFPRLLRAVGWVVISARFGGVLFYTGDIMISLPAAIGVFFLIAGDLSLVFTRTR